MCVCVHIIIINNENDEHNDTFLFIKIAVVHYYFIYNNSYMLTTAPCPPKEVKGEETKYDVLDFLHSHAK